MTQETFTVLIGSFARGAGGPDSDLDILRIGHTRPIERPVNICKNVYISYIDYDHSVFTDLFEQGSLFLYHVFEEGTLLDGNQEIWASLKRTFTVSINYSDSIEEYVAVLEFIDNYPGFEFSFAPFLSNIFKAIKNIGIFKLAEKGKFIFDKKSALVMGCGLTDRQADFFISANNAFERSQLLSPDTQDSHRMFAQEWKNTQKKFIQRMAHDL